MTMKLCKVSPALMNNSWAFAHSGVRMSKNPNIEIEIAVKFGAMGLKEQLIVEECLYALKNTK